LLRRQPSSRCRKSLLRPRATNDKTHCPRFTFVKRLVEISDLWSICRRIILDLAGAGGMDKRMAAIGNVIRAQRHASGFRPTACHRETAIRGAQKARTSWFEAGREQFAYQARLTARRAGFDKASRP
jgi:hypothetical protein